MVFYKGVRRVDQRKRLERHKALLEWYEALIFGAVLVVLLFTFVFRVAVVQGSSMNPTLQSGDRVLLWSAGYTPQRGDVVVVDGYTSYEKALCKRIIALGGDEINIDFASGEVWVNGQLLEEDYIAHPTQLSEGVSFPLTVPEGTVFVMGDNRMNSTDSRSPEIGCIDQRDLLGRVVLRILPVTAFGVVK